jgi:hypothetical protein
MGIWEGRVRIILRVMASAVVLAGCASQLSKYVQTDGAPVDAAQEQATLAQCKSEAATTVTGNTGAFFLNEYRKENTVISGCMARNGYIQAQ